MSFLDNLKNFFTDHPLAKTHDVEQTLEEARKRVVAEQQIQQMGTEQAPSQVQQEQPPQAPSIFNETALEKALADAQKPEKSHTSPSTRTVPGRDKTAGIER